MKEIFHKYSDEILCYRALREEDKVKWSVTIKSKFGSMKCDIFRLIFSVNNSFLSFPPPPIAFRSL